MGARGALGMVGMTLLTKWAPFLWEGVEGGQLFLCDDSLVSFFEGEQLGIMFSSLPTRLVWFWVKGDIKEGGQGIDFISVISL